MDGEERFMRAAIELATGNVLSGNGGPFGAVVVRDGVIVATGVNMVTAKNDPTAHAEVIAIRNACSALETFELQGCSLYSSCEPCPMCLTATLWARVTHLYFASTASDAANAGFDDLHFYDQVARPFDQRELPTQNLLRVEGAASFRAWHTFSARVAY